MRPLGTDKVEPFVIGRITLSRSKVTIDYTPDIARKGAEPLIPEVLPLIQSGSPDKCPKALFCGIASDLR